MYFELVGRSCDDYNSPAASKLVSNMCTSEVKIKVNIRVFARRFLRAASAINN